MKTAFLFSTPDSGQNSLPESADYQSFEDKFEAQLNSMSIVEIISTLEMQANFVSEFQPHRQDYLEQLGFAIDMVSNITDTEIAVKTLSNLLFQ